MSPVICRVVFVFSVWCCSFLVCLQRLRFVVRLFRSCAMHAGFLFQICFFFMFVCPGCWLLFTFFFFLYESTRVYRLRVWLVLFVCCVPLLVVRQHCCDRLRPKSQDGWELFLSRRVIASALRCSSREKTRFYFLLDSPHRKWRFARFVGSFFLRISACVCVTFFHVCFLGVTIRTSMYRYV